MLVFNEPAPMNKILNTRWLNIAYHTISSGFPLFEGDLLGHIHMRDKYHPHTYNIVY